MDNGIAVGRSRSGHSEMQQRGTHRQIGHTCIYLRLSTWPYFRTRLAG